MSVGAAAAPARTCDLSGSFHTAAINSTRYDVFVDAQKRGPHCGEIVEIQQAAVQQCSSASSTIMALAASIIATAAQRLCGERAMCTAAFKAQFVS